MFEKDLVLYNPQIENEPLILEFEENVFIGNKDQIICKITLEQAYQMLEHSYGEYLENNIYIPRDVERYLKELKEEKEIWKQVDRTEKAVQEILKKERKRDRI